MRIASLLPSATEMICEIGLSDQLCGVSHECDYPESIAGLPRVTRSLIPPDATSGQIDSFVREQMRARSALYSLDFETLYRIAPDLIVTQSLCDVCAVSDDEVRLAAARLPGNPQVIDLQPDSLGGVFETLMVLGRVTGRMEAARACVAKLNQRVEAVRRDGVRRLAEAGGTRPRVMVMEWIDPPFTAGHWTPELVEIAGGREVLGVAGQRSIATDWDAVLRADPEVLVIACCGFGVGRTMEDLPLVRFDGRFDRLGEMSCVRSGRVYVVDGNAYFNRPGPRLVDSLEILSYVLEVPGGRLPSPIDPASVMRVDLMNS
jgi:iron complex transport system substrate-binding protein